MHDVVWTTLTTGATAVLSGGIGWAGARQQVRLELAKLKQERDAGTSENLGFRQELYLRYLETADAVRRFSVLGDGTADGFIQAYSSFIRVDDEMELFAAATVIAARAKLLNVAKALIAPFDGELDKRADRDLYAMQKLSEANESVSEEWIAARRELILAIREDVGPKV